MLDETSSEEPVGAELERNGKSWRFRFAIRAGFMPLYEQEWRWAVVVAHRRAGKTVAAVQRLVRRAVEAAKRPMAPPRFSYIAPTYTMAKDIAWPYLVQYVQNIPGIDIRVSELSVTFPHNGSRIRLYGSDRYDTLRGGYNDGIVADEVADWHPEAWSGVVRPTLSDYSGWALFIGTPKGDNLFKQMSETARLNEDGQWLYVELPASRTGLLSEEELRDARRQMSASLYAQEYECSFSAGVMGAIYAADVEVAEKGGRITSVPHDRASDVYCAWDLGIGDTTALLVYQVVGKEVHYIDAHEDSGQPLGHYVDWIKDRPYKVNALILPPDAEARELQTGMTRVEFIQSRGLNNLIVLPKHRVEDGIEAVRVKFPSMWFDKGKTELAVKAFRNYRYSYDDKRKVFTKVPYHNWASNFSDCLRYSVMGLGMVAVPVDDYSDYETDWVL